MKRIVLLVLTFVCLLSPAFGEPGWNTDGVKKTAADLLKKEDFAGLDKLAADIKARGYDIRQTYPELGGFYSSFRIDRSASEAQWLDQQAKLEYWIKSQPDSLSAKIALADWYIGYGWKARGTAYANQVTDEGWNLLGERLRKASDILRAIPVEKIDDPEFYRLWSPLEAEPTHTNRGSGGAAFKKGAALFKEYYPLYSERAYFLLPKWYGEEGDWEKFATEAANGFPGEKGDILYARIVRNEARDYDGSFFQQCKVDYPRVKRGYLTASANPKDRVADLSNLAYLAAIKGDKETAVKLILSLGGSIHRSAFGPAENFYRLRKDCGAEDIINKALEAERTGKIDEAEKLFVSFHPDKASNPWLGDFYLRQGIEAKLRAMLFKNDQPYSHFLDADIATATPNTLAELSKIAPQVGQWDKAEAAAQAFNQNRPWNLIGKNTLWLCALHKGDKVQAEAFQKELAKMKTNRPAYLAAQAVISGSKTWEQARADFKPRDAYNAQAVTAIALHYHSIGQGETAREAIRELLPICNEAHEKTLLESMLYGSVSRSMNPPVSSGSAGAVL